MKKIFLLISTVLTGLFAMSQGKLLRTGDAVVAQMEASRKSTAPYSVRFTEGANFKTAQEQNLFKKYLGLRDGMDELKLKTSDVNLGGIRVDRFQQFYKNIRVEHGSYIATSKNGNVAFINGDFYAVKPTTVTIPSLSESAALSKALMEVGAKTYKWQIPVEEAFIKRETKNPAATYFPKGELVFVEDFNTGVELTGKVTLAYKFDIYAEEPVSRQYVYVDAKSGKVLLRDAIIKHLNDSEKPKVDGKSNMPTGIKNAVTNTTTIPYAPTVVASGASRYSGTVSFPTTLVGSNYLLQSTLAADNYPLRTLNMKKGSNYGAAVDFTDADNNWTAAEYDNANRDNVAIDAHWGAMEVINYWRTRHGRNSYDNNNATILSYVHYGNNYDNAYWNGVAMTYGDGSNVNGGFSPLTALDVCGHEIGHAVCTNTANLVYERESGAMNEAFSDIWGASIEHFADPHETDAVPKSYFLIGEEIGLPYPNSPLRSMSNPKSQGQPDTYGGTYWRNPSVTACPVPNSNTNDNCWVHYNSGVLNHWFYIMVKGKTGTNDVGFSYNITGIDWVDAEKITYLGEQNLASSADHKAARTAMYNAATVLFGACSVQASTVLKAFDAVNVLGAAIEPTLTLTQDVTQQQEGLDVTYNNHLVSVCPTLPVVNYVLRDTLPTNVTFVSATNGGTYNAGTRVVSYPVNIAGGASADYAFTVTINPGSYFTPVILLDDAVGTTIPAATWSTSSTTSNVWVSSTARSHSVPNSYFSVNTAVASDQRLFSTNTISIPAAPPALSFWHWYNTERLYDGGILEISIDGGTTYNQVLNSGITAGGYSGTMDASTVLNNKMAWTGTNGGWTKVVVPMTPYANQNVKLRFRSTTDAGTNAEGWYVDDISIKNVPQVLIHTSLFNAASVIVSTADIATDITQAPLCASITEQPVPVVLCEGEAASFTVTASGNSLSYQWQVSAGGTPFTNIAGAMSATLALPAVDASLNGNLYRVVVVGTCTPVGVNSNAVLLTVNSKPVITASPVNVEVCAPGAASFSVAAIGSMLTYQWQVTTDGINWASIAGATSSTLSFAAVTTAMNGNQYRAVVSGTCAPSVNSTAATLKVNTPVNIVSQPVSTSTCVGSNASFGVSALGTNVTYQWQVSINGGGYVNIPNGGLYTGVSSNQLTITNAPVSINGYTYRVVATGIPCGGTASSGATLTVNTLPVVVATLSSFNRITPYVQTQLTTTISPAGTYTYQWFKNSVAVSGLTSATVPLNVDGFGEYKVVVTDSKGCSNVSNNVVLSDSASSLLFIYPNPNRGHFQVRYYNLGGGTIGRTINIYDAKGGLVYSKPYSVSNPYGKMDVDFKAGAGVYFVDLKDASGKTLASGKVVIAQ